MQGRALLVLLVPVALALFAYRDVPALGYTGVDAPPWVRGSDLTTQRGLSFLLAEKHFVSYRPFTALSYALGRLVHGTGPAGYQVTDLLLHLACVAAAFALGQKLFGSTFSAGVVAGVVALHPIGIEAVPVLARRGDLLVALLGTLAVLASLRGHSLTASGLTFLAFFTKEPAAVLPLVIFGVGWVEGGESVRDRLQRAAARALGPLLALVAGLGLRLLVLGGLGGYEREAFPRWGIAGDFLLGLAFPNLGALFPSLALSPLPAPPALRLTMLAATLALPLGAVIVAGRRCDAPRTFRPAFLAAGPLWLLAHLALYVASGTFLTRLLYPSLVPLGVTVAWMIARARDGRPRWRCVGGGALVLPLLITWIVYGPLARGSGEWREASRLQRNLLMAIENGLRDSGGEPVVLVANYPFGIKIDPAQRRPSFARAEVFFDLDFTEPAGETGIQDLVALTREGARIEPLTYLTARQAGLVLDIEVTSEEGLLCVRQRGGPYDSHGNPKLGIFGPAGSPIVYDRPLPAGTRLLLFDLRAGEMRPFPRKVVFDVVP
ncbi:MAG: hypothetical protein AB1486_10900 [Planctomycetota bacterium]